MVSIVDYKTYQKDDGTEFHALVVQGGLEAVKSNQTDRTYFTARTARVACTFNEDTCKSLLGTQIPGKIKKVMVEPYEFLIPQTGEMISLSHRFDFVSDEEAVIQEQFVESFVVN